MRALSRRVVAIVLTLWPGAAVPSRGADWTMLGRDATRNAVSAEKGAPTRWQVEIRDKGALKQPAWNIKWEAEIGSTNCASPVVAGGLVWIGTNNDRPRDPKVKGDAAILMCFREADGKFLWQYVSPRLENGSQDYAGAGINCSPLAEGDRLYFSTNRGEIVCLDVGPLRQGKGDPRLLWKLDMRKELGVSPSGPQMNYGYTCSLSAAYKGRLYVTTGNGVGDDQMTVPAPKAPSLVCLDRDTGKVLWLDNSPGKDILQTQYSSPLVVEVRGRVQVIAAQGDGWVRSFDALTGELLWKFDTNPKASKWKPGGHGSRNFLPATPVFHDGLVYIANGREADDGDGVGHLWCIDPARVPKNKEKDLSPIGDNFDPKAEVNKDSGLVWHHGGSIIPKPKKNERDVVFARTMSNVAIHDGLVIAVEIAGFVQCLDARTGKRHWTFDTNDAIFASPLIVDGKIYVPTQGSNVIVLSLSRALKLLGTNDVQDASHSSPVFANGVLYLATSWKLYAIKAGPGPQPNPAPPNDDGKKPAVPSPPPSDRKPNDAFVPTPQDVVERMLELAKVKPTDVVYDLGCGDGRIVVTAARKYGCKAYGCDIDSECVKMAIENVEKNEVGRLVTIEKKDIFSVDLREADVVALYLLPRTNERLLPQLSKLRAGSRIVSHAFDIPGIQPNQVVVHRSKVDDRDHKIYVWTLPLKRLAPEQ